MQRFLHPLVLTGLSAFLILLFLVSMIWTYGPIVKVEATYQTKKIMRDVFHAQDWRGIILPNLQITFSNSRKHEFEMHIPAIFLNEPIIFNVDPDDPAAYTAALKNGIAHAAGTDLPGKEGLGYYFAHSSEPDFVSQYNAVFYLLGKLQTHDQIILWHHEDEYRYRVIDRRVVDPTDVNFLSAQYERPTIVLQTCWPPGLSQKRLLIFAERE